LQAINKPILPLIGLGFALVIRSILIVFLVPLKSLNIFGVAISNIVFLTIASLVCLLFVRKYISLKFGIYQTFLAPIFAVSVASGVSIFLREIFVNNTNIYIYFVASACVGAIVYLGLIFLLKSFTKDESAIFPKFIKKSRKIV
jgi:stage V sporulation protein B